MTRHLRNLVAVSLFAGVLATPGHVFLRATSGWIGLTNAAGDRSFAIRGATILTVTNGTIEKGTVLVRDGRIAAVGAAVAVPAGTRIIEAGGRFVTPGLIDAHSHIAVDAINESGTAVSSMTSMVDVLNPTDINIYRNVAGGLTTANILHGSANPIGGKNAVIKLRWGRSRAEDLLFEGAPPGIKFALGENPKDMRQPTQNSPRRYPATRPGVEFVIRDAFTRAKAYQREWQAYERRQAKGEDVIPPRRDLQLEPLVEVLEGTRLVHAHCYRADEILMLIRVAEETGFRIATFQHVLEGYKVAREIAAHGAGASTFSDWWGYKIEAVDAIPHNAALMMRKGVLVSVNSDSAEHARRLNTEAAKSIKWGGLTEDEALALVTINPARQLGIAARVGSIETGKDADLVIWTHHPLSSYAIVEQTWIDGELYYERQAEEHRLTMLREEKRELAGGRPAVAVRAGTHSRPDAGSRQNRGARRQQSNGSDATAPRIVGAQHEPARSTNGDGTHGPDGERSGDEIFGPRGDVLAITNARIVPVTQPVIERGTILIRGTLIEAVGTDVAIPADAQIIDAGGGEVYPGWINARSTLGLAEPGARGFQDIEEMLDYNPQLRTSMAFHADSLAIPVARANGVTTIAATPSGGVLGGEIAVMNLDGWTWEESTVRSNAGIAFQFPTIAPPGAVPGQGPGHERTYEQLRRERDGKLDALAQLLEQARAYGREPAAERPVNWVLEALVPVVAGELPLVARASRAADIRAAVAFADRVQVRLVISGGLEAPLFAPLLAERRIPVILGPVLTLPTGEDLPHAASYQAARELAAAGVTFAFATGDHTNARLLPYHAAQSVAWGLAREDALRALTIDAAEILGVGDRLGSLEAGKVANLLIARGDPLEIRTPVTHVIINGRPVDLGNHQQALYERFLQRP